MPAIVSIDQGTSGTTALVLNLDGVVIGKGYQEHRQYFPHPGWVEHEPTEILEGVAGAVTAAMAVAGIAIEDVAAVGLTNQRETVVVWDASTGKPVDRAIVWQCRRTADACSRLREEGAEELVRTRTGLVLDPYFSAAKIAWLLDAAPGRRAAAERGALLAGTIDSWLTWQLSGGADHVTDATNASRTSLMSLATLDWDADLLTLFRVPRACLPRIVPSAGRITTLREGPLHGAPLTGMAGDQQAALFGHRCCAAGEAKNTYGTGCFLLRHIGPSFKTRADGILTTVACGPAGLPEYAWEGSVFMGGAVVQWLRDELGVLPTSSASEALARQVSDSGGVVMVPAFTGLGAPYWDPAARGAVLGLTRGSSRAHLARAALESIAFQSAELDAAMAGSAGVTDTPARGTGPVAGKTAISGAAPLNVDGGAATNDLLMQIQADLLGRTLLRARQAETTALGAGYLAGVGAGIWGAVHDVPACLPPEPFHPTLSEDERRSRLFRWRRAVEAVRQFGP